MFTKLLLTLRHAQPHVEYVCFSFTLSKPNPKDWAFYFINGKKLPPQIHAAMLPQKIKHHRVASGPEPEESSGIRLESLHITEAHAQNPLGQSTLDSNETLSSVTALDDDDDDDDDDEDDSRIAGRGKLWVPFFLRRTTLLSFAISFIILLVTLIALWQTSEKKQGLSRVNSNNYYLWTYGPTAVFAIISALWGQFEYRALQLLPWRLMSRGFAPALDSVFLDYLSMWNVWALIKSLQRRHFIVSVAVAASLIIKVMTALSTGLFTATDVQLEFGEEFQVQKVFDGTGYNQSAVNSQVYLKAWGVAQHNLSNPVGTTTGHAFQNFFYDSNSSGTPIYLPNNTYTATVDVFTPSLECEEASATTYEDSTDVELRTDGCLVKIRGEVKNQFTLMQAVLGSCDGDDISEVGRQPGSSSALDRALDVKSIDWRLWIYVSQWREEGKGQPVPYPGEPTNLHYVDTIGLMCKLSYSTDSGSVTLSGTGDDGQPSIDLTIASPVDTPGLANISASSILYGSYLSIVHAANSIGARRAEYLLLDTDEPGLKNTFNIHTLTDRVTEQVHALAVQLVSEYLMSPSDITVTGTMKKKEARLTLRDASVYAIVSILGLLALFSLLFTTFCLPYAVCSRDPGSIGGLATILANSHKLMDALSRTGHSSKKDLRSVLAGQTYTTTANDGTFSIEQHDSIMDKSAQSSQVSWWRPFSATPFARTLVLLVPICLIIVLEILYQKSRSSSGLADVSASPALSYTWTYVPALVMLLVRTLFESVYFSARVFQPYHELKRGHASPEKSIMDNQHRKVAVVGVWDALIKRHWAIMAAGVTVVIAPFLPVVVSGLYSVSDVASASSITLTQKNTLNMSDGHFYSNMEDYEDVKLGDMILQYNLSCPQWTYQDLSFPKLEVDTRLLDNETANALDKNDYFVEADVPALRLGLGCEGVPAEAYFAAPDPDFDDELRIKANITTLIDSCGFKADGLTSAGFVSSANTYFNGYDEPTVDNASELPSSCPGLIVMYGRVAPTLDKVEEITVLKCRPKIEQMNVHVRLSLPSYTFDLTSPPSVVANSTTTLFDAYMGEPQYEGQGDDLVAADGNQMESAILDLYPGDRSTENLDPIFRSIIYGEDGVSAEALLDPETLKTRLQKVWSTVTAQMINSRGRRDYDDDNPLDPPIGERPTYSATLNNPFRTRLVQSKISTRILQAILATMTVCGAVSIFLMDTRDVLPKNPLSIAAAASLLADSSILGPSGHAKSEGMIPPGSEWCNDEQLKQRGVFQGRTFTLGWWDAEINVERNDNNYDNIDVNEPEPETDDTRSVINKDNKWRWFGGTTSTNYVGADETRKRFGIDADKKFVA